MGARAALRPFVNTGVQYGLAALNSGAITVQQFIDLNEKIGGIDQDANYTPARAVGFLRASPTNDCGPVW